MSTCRVANAVEITAYTTHPDDIYGDFEYPHEFTRSRHGSVSATVNMKAKNRLRDDRPEDERFNVAVNPGAFRKTSRARHRTARSERREERVADDAVPGFPPPSFQEAVSTVGTDDAFSVRSTTQRSTSDLNSMLNGDIEHTQPQRSPGIEFPTHSSRPSVSGSESDGSLVNIYADVNLDQELPIVQQLTPWTPDQKISARRPRQPQPTAALATSHDCKCASASSPPRSPPRDAPHPPPSPTAVTKRRHLSLAPLRTLFPIGGSHDRRHSAHASPTAGHRFANGIFKKDSPSLLPTPLKLYESHGPAPSPTHHDNFLTRKIFGHKGKDWHEQLKQYSGGEVKFAQMEDQWEALVIEQDDFSSSGSSHLSSPSQLTLPVNCPQHSPPPSQTTFSSAASICSILAPGQTLTPSPGPVPSSPPPASTTPEVPPNPYAPHPLSLRDQKVKPQTPVQRQPQPRREGSPPSFTQSPLPPPAPQPSLCSPKTSPRPTHAKGRSHAASPLATESWKPDDDDDNDNDTLHPALRTPVMPTPIDPFMHDPKPRTPSIHRRKDVKKHAYHDSISLQSGSIRSQTTLKNTSEKFTSETETDHYSVRSRENEMYSSWQAHKSTVSLFTSDDTSSRRHYPGRPLPRPPPGVRKMIDSTINAYEEIKAEIEKSKKHVAAKASAPASPEGRSSDLDDPPTPPPSPPASHYASDDWARKRLTSKSVVTLPGERLGSNENDLDYSWPPSPPVPRTVTPRSHLPSSDSPVMGGPIPRMPKVTRSGRDRESFMELQAFISHFNNVTARNRLESEVSASTPEPQTKTDGCKPRQQPAQVLTQRLSGVEERKPIDSPPASPVIDNIDNRSSIIGIVELERRRAGRDGRVKLKLSLFDVSVDKCALCRKQFKNGERAEMNAKCKHAFHEACLKNLFPQGMGACPMEHPQL